MRDYLDIFISGDQSRRWLKVGIHVRSEILKATILTFYCKYRPTRHLVHGSLSYAPCTQLESVNYLKKRIASIQCSLQRSSAFSSPCLHHERSASSALVYKYTRVRSCK